MSNQNYVGILLGIIISIAIQEKLLAIGILATIGFLIILIDNLVEVIKIHKSKKKSNKAWIDRYEELISQDNKK